MGKRTIMAFAALALLACGGGKGADSPGTCPAGTTLKGSDCVPSGDDDSAGSAGGGTGGGTAKKGDDGDTPSGGGGGGGGGGDAIPSGSTPYDKEAVDVQLKRAARQVKANCGTATDDDGKATGPWGSTKVSIVLGRNGHVKQVTIPAPYDGKPVGLCVVHAFQRIQFPPYAGSSDVVLDWDIEIIPAETVTTRRPVRSVRARTTFTPPVTNEPGRNPKGHARPGAHVVVKRGVAWVALGLPFLLPGLAHADVAPPATVESSPTTSPKRTVPDYDGRGPAPTGPGDVALWVPRILLSPVYFVSEYVLRLPLSVAIPAAERTDLPRKVYDFFTFGPEHKAGFSPIGLVEFNFNPSVGVYAFWDDAGFKGDDLRLHVEAWPDEWLAGSLTQHIVLDDRRSVEFRVSGLRRPDKVFYGIGPSSLEADQSRYGIQRVDAGAAYSWRFWRSSQIQTMAGVRDVSTYDGHYRSDPGLTEEAATGAFAIPDGFGREYTAEYNRLLAAVDTRAHVSPLGSGVRLELAAEQGSDLRASPASGWIRYGGTLAGYVDLNGYGRILGLQVTTIFVDPLGPEPVPFTELAYLGGDHPMAGYYEGRLRDRSAAAATATYSWPIGPWLDGRLEAAVGNVFAAHLAGFDAGLLRFSGALGLSVAGLENAPVELLVGLGSETFDHGGQIDSVRVSLGVPHTF